MNTTDVAECNIKEEKKEKRAIMALIWLCWLAYSCSYIGKVNYTANINEIMASFGVSHAEAGLVGTFMFFSYGIGQFVNGILCKKYNVKYVVFGGLMLSGIINLAVAAAPYFEMIKYLWLLNGIALSVLWSSVIRLLSECLSKRDMGKATVIIGTTVASGTFIIYVFSAIFTAFNAYKLAFVMAGVVMPAVAIIWLLSVSKLSERAKAVSKQYEEEDASAQAGQKKTNEHSERKLLLLIVGVLAFVAIAVNLINDGLKTWIPSILKENYDLGSSLSVLLSLALPLVTMFSNFFAVRLNKKVPDFVLQCVIAFGIGGTLLAVVIASLSIHQFALTLICFALVCFFIASCNSLITSIFPLFMKDKLNSGMIAGLLNGFCYVGSTISAYGLGLVADFWNWTAVFVLLLAVCILVCLVGMVYLFVKRIIKAHAERN